MKQSTLLILAAGVGNRYGGLKQIDNLGPNGECLMDYAIFDAKNAGFKRVVFVIRPDLEGVFSSMFGEGQTGMETRFVFQRPDDLPRGFLCPEGRAKPWGTAHAVYAARDALNGPFGIIGADDFFGRDTMEKLYKSLEAVDGNNFSIIGFRLENTVPEKGAVSRGVCRVENGMLTGVTERAGIAKDINGEIICEDGIDQPISKGSLTSLNVWGMHPDIFGFMEEDFSAFLQNRGGEAGAEYYLPAVVDDMIKKRGLKVRVEESASKWFGVTNPEDRATVVERLAAMHLGGEYPSLR